MPDTDFLDDLRGALKESKIIQVSPAAGDMSPVSEQSMPFDSAGPIFDGGSPLRLDNKLWHYVAVNPLSKDKLESLRKEIETLTYGGKPVNVADLHKPEILIALSSELRDRYEKVFKGGNEYSMCVLSEAENRYKFEFYSHLYHIRENAASAKLIQKLEDSRHFPSPFRNSVRRFSRYSGGGASYQMPFRVPRFRPRRKK